MVKSTCREIAWFAAISTVLTLNVAAAASETEPLIDQLDPELRARVLMALLGLVLVGLALIAVVVMGARYVRRLGRGRSTHAPVKDDAWFAKPLNPPDAAPRRGRRR